MYVAPHPSDSLDSWLPTSDRVRTIVHSQRVAVLSVVDTSGSVLSSSVDYACIDDGSLLFLFSKYNPIHRCLRKNPSCSVNINSVVYKDISHPRCCLQGTASRSNSTEYRQIYKNIFPETWRTQHGPDLFVFRVKKVRAVLGFGQAYWIKEEKYYNACPDLISSHLKRYLDHMNEDHVEDLKLYVSRLVPLKAENFLAPEGFDPSSKWTSIMLVELDALGMTLRIGTENSAGFCRIAWKKRLTKLHHYKAVLVNLSQRLRAKL